MPRRKRNLTPKEEAEKKKHFESCAQFKRLAKEREKKAEDKDAKFLQAYEELCVKHKRYIGSMHPENWFMHLKTSKGTRRDFAGCEFLCYNRSEDRFPDVRSSWYLGSKEG